MANHGAKCRRSSGTNRLRKSYRLGIESLERRELLAANVTSPTVVDAPLDVSPATQMKRLIVEMRDEVGAQSVFDNIESATVIRELKNYPLVIVDVPESSIPEIEAHESVASFQVDAEHAPSLASTIPLINADDAHAAGLVGGGTHTVERQSVVILDTGIDTTHPFFGPGGSQIIVERCFSTPLPDVNDQSLCPNGQATDTSADVNTANCNVFLLGNICDHGTHVAGIAAGNMFSDPNNTQDQSVAPGANIIAMQVFRRVNDISVCGLLSTPCTLALTSDIISALDEVVDLSQTQPFLNIAAVNMSLGGGEFTTNCDTDLRKGPIDDLLSNGIPTVIAAGNASFDAAVSAPACISSAIAVGSSTDADAVSDFSNRGTLLDVFAPGSDVVSSVPGGYVSLDGTSMAAPHVAGALAILKDANPNRSVTELVDDLTATGVPITYSSNGANVTTPRINLAAALADDDDTIANANVLTLNSPTSGEILRGITSDVDLYAFSAARGQQIGFDTDTFGSNLDTRIRIFDSQGQQLAQNDDGIGPNPEDDGLESYLEYTFPAQGTYYVGISEFRNSSYDVNTGNGDSNTDFATVGAYTLEARSLGVEGNGTLSTATSVSLGDNLNGRIDPSVEVDMVRFTATANQEVQAIVDVQNGGLISHVRVFDAAGNQLASQSGSVNAPDATVGFLVPSTGTYFVGVSSRANRDYDPVGGSAAAANALSQTGDFVLRLRADSSVVTTTADVVAADGFTSLREAVNVANSILGTNFISFDPDLFSTPQTIRLDGELSLTDDVFIEGPGADLLTIDAQNSSRVFHIDDGFSNNQLVVLQNMRMIGGNAVDGAAIFNDEDLRIFNSAIEFNHASNRGGGIFNRGELQVSNSTIADNTAGGRGGGIHQSVSSSTTNIFQSTISGNTAGVGGGLDSYRGDVNVHYSTISNNSGGGIFSFGNYSYVETRLNSSIVSGNQGGDVVRHANYQTTIFSDGHNLIGNGTAEFRFNQPGDVVGVDPRLGPLTDNGGSTRTHALLLGSPAIDAGDPDILPSITDDQRGDGFPRILGDQVDMGALETNLRRDLIVDSVSDADDGDYSPGNLTLREAIRLANELDELDSIDFDSDVFATPQTITLTGSQLEISKSLTINGPGADRLTVSGGNASRVFNVEGAGTNTSFLNDLTIAEGRGDFGGGIRVAGDDTLNVNRSTIRDNVASASGGGFEVAFGATLNVHDSAIINNQANQSGGINLFSSNASISGSTISGNTAGLAAAVLAFGSDSILTIDQTTVAENSGGGATIRAEGNAVVNFGNSIFASTGSNFFASGTANLSSQGHNISNDATGNLIAAGDMPNTDPLLAPLANNGGRTLSHALMEGSPAANGGDPAVNGGVDQTGAARVVGGIMDVGSVESSLPVVRVLGSLPEGPSAEPAYDLREREVAFYRFELVSDVMTANGQRLTIDTLGSTLDGSNDTELGLFDAIGNRIATNDDFLIGSRLSELSFGVDGENGDLLTGTYYLAISGFDTVYEETDFGASSTSDDNGSLVVNFDLTLPSLVDGDFNDDGLYNCSDMDALTSNIIVGSGDLAFDLDGNGQLDMGDVTAWRIEAGAANNASGGAYLPGDANLDGVVDASDFNVWNANKFGSGTWCTADFTLDGVVDASDFNVWNANKFSASDSDAIAGISFQLELHDFGGDTAEHEPEESRLVDAVFGTWAM